ncbi:MAG TPA: sigma-54-dependent Fis family transcriptional regulator, partial [Candidatus Tenderia sp.]|nr:sigma-54-dependent Fis family transcriptional regulator [Candidatus Tenderia sp.]
LDDSRLRRENQSLRRHVHSPTQPLGHSDVMEALRRQAEKVAGSEARVLICGEPGVGRQLLARYIHQNSPRKAGPFVELGVASITAENAARELFGEEVGGKVHYGRLEQAHGGTLYLNEVVDMDLNTQGRLFSALQSQGVVRVGGASQIGIDVRVMASTQKDIQEAVAKGHFREDLYYALNVVPVTVPPLREHAADIPQLLAYYLDYFANNEGLGQRRFSAAAQDRLRQHTWPGNVRELKNLVQRLLILGSGEEILLDEVMHCLGGAPVADLALASGMASGFDQPLRAAREQFERAYLEHHLRETRGNITLLAKVAGMERTHLYRKMKALGVNPKDDAI